MHVCMVFQMARQHLIDRIWFAAWQRDIGKSHAPVGFLLISASRATPPLGQSYASFTSKQM